MGDRERKAPLVCAKDQTLWAVHDDELADERVCATLDQYDQILRFAYFDREKSAPSIFAYLRNFDDTGNDVLAFPDLVEQSDIDNRSALARSFRACSDINTHATVVVPRRAERWIDPDAASVVADEEDEIERAH